MTITTEITDAEQKLGLEYIAWRFNQERLLALAESEREGYVTVTPEAYLQARIQDLLNSYKEQEAAHFRAEGLRRYDALTEEQRAAIQQQLGLSRNYN